MTNPFSNFALFELLYAHRAQGILLVVVSTKLKDEECPMPPGIMRDMKATPPPPPPVNFSCRYLPLFVNLTFINHLQLSLTNSKTIFQRNNVLWNPPKVLDIKLLPLIRHFRTRQADFGSWGVF